MYDCKSGGSQLKSYHLGYKLSPQKYFHFYELQSQKRMWLLGENTHPQCCCFLLCREPSGSTLLACILPITQWLLWLLPLSLPVTLRSTCLERAWAPICPWRGKAEWVSLPNSGRSTREPIAVSLTTFSLPPFYLTWFRTWMSRRNISILTYNEICFIGKILGTHFFWTKWCKCITRA